MPNGRFLSPHTLSGNEYLKAERLVKMFAVEIIVLTEILRLCRCYIFLYSNGNRRLTKLTLVANLIDPHGGRDKLLNINEWFFKFWTIASCLRSIIKTRFLSTRVFFKLRNFHVWNTGFLLRYIRWV